MRHRQTTGAGPWGARPSIVVLMLTAAGGGLTAGLGQTGGAWAGYGAASLAALVGCGALWQQRGLLERHSSELARRRRAELDEAAAAELRHEADLARVRAELEHEQQYSALIQDQLTRAREQIERERAARRTAEQELDALTGAAGWPVGETVPQPRSAGTAAAQRRGWQVVDGDGEQDADVTAAETDRLYRPFIDQLAPATVPVSDAALAMAPVIAQADVDGILDLTAYDETVEFSVREIKRMA